MRYFLVCWLEIILGSVSQKFPEYTQKNILMGVQFARTKTKNFAENGLVTDLHTLWMVRHTTNGPSMVSVDLK